MIAGWGFYIMTPQDYVATAAELTAELYEETFEKWMELFVEAERWGYDGITFAEHHFMPTSMTASPHIVAAALLAKTKRLRVTELGGVLFMHHGWRYAAESAMLRYMSKGRYEPGIAPGSGPTEAVMAGIAAAEIRPRYYSAAEFLEQSMTGLPVTMHDGFHEVDQLPITPRWDPSPDQSVWVTVLSPDSAAWTARRGWKLATGWVPINIAAAVTAAYREAAEASGHSTDPSMLGIRRRVFVADSDAEAQEKYEASVSLIPMMMRSEASQMELADERIRNMVMNPDDLIIGSPETVAEKLIDQCRTAGFGNVFAWGDFASFRWADLAHSMELFGTKVIPTLHSATIDSAAANIPSGGDDATAAFLQNRDHVRDKVSDIRLNAAH